MLNLKKGLALVLAAATAFTFAPVANLGNAVDANAATDGVTETLTIPGDAYSSTGHTTSATPTATTIGYDSIKAVIQSDGLKIENLKAISSSKNSVFQIFSVSPSIDNYLDFDAKTKGVDASDQATNMLYNNSVSTGSTAGLVENNYVKSDASGVINFGNVYIHKGGVSQIVLADLGPGATKSVTNAEKLTIVINADQNKALAPSSHVYKTKFSAKNNVATVDWNDSTSVASELTSQLNTYLLDLNKYEPGYLLAWSNNGNADGTDTAEATTGTQGINYTNWAGSTVSVTSIKLNADNRTINWWNPSKTLRNSDGTTNAAGSYVAGAYETTPEWTLSADSKKFDDVATIANVYTVSKHPNGVIFKTTAATVGTDSIHVVFEGANGGSLDSDDVANAKVNYTTDKSDAAFDDISTTTGKIAKRGDGSYDFTGLDVQINNSGKITTKTESGDVRYISVDPSIISIDEKTGEFKVYKKGTTSIQVYTGETVNNKANITTIHVTVSPFATDVIDLTSDQDVEFYSLNSVDYLDLDVPTQTAAGAKTKAKIDAVSKGGLTPKFEVIKGTDVVTVDQSGNVTALKKGSATIRVSTSNDVKKEIFGTHRDVQVTVWDKPAVQFTVDPITVNVNESSLIAVHVTRPEKDATYTVNYGKDADKYYTLTNPSGTNTNTQTSSRVLGKQIGTSEVLVQVVGTANTRPTTRRQTVTVLDKSAVNTITAAIGSESVVLKEGETKTIEATSSTKKDVTFVSADPSVATVSATTGSAIVTAVKAGQTTITAKSEGAADVVIPVVITSDKDNVAAPEAVTGLKVSNKKGAYVSVKWDSQDKNINYRIYKKVGKGKWVGKNVAGSKTTLSVKKGAKVQVKVKSYVKDSTGKTTWGPAATKAKTFKTDKK